MKFRLLPAGTLLLLCVAGAHAQSALLRFTCDGDNEGADVAVNGKFKGQCPFDMSVPAGTVLIRASKSINADRERVFEQELRMGDGIAKRIEILLGPPQASAEAIRREAARAEDARKDEQRREDERRRAAAAIRAKADAGDASAMLMLSRLHETGNGIEKNAAQALEWLRKAADAGLPEAMSILELRQENAKAEAGDRAAMVALGDRHANGIGVEKNPVEAATWYRKAAAAGSVLGAFKLSEAYKRGGKQYVDDVVQLLSLPSEPSRNVSIAGKDATRQFIESDPFFEVPGGGQKLEYSFTTQTFEHGTHYQGAAGASVQTASCVRAGRLAQLQYKTTKILDFEGDGPAVLGGLLPLDIKTGFGFLKSYKTEMVGITRIDGQPFPPVTGKRFGIVYKQNKTNGASGHAGDVSTEALSCAVGADAASVVCLYQGEKTRANFVLARYTWNDAAGCFLQSYESDGIRP